MHLSLSAIVQPVKLNFYNLRFISLFFLRFFKIIINYRVEKEKVTMQHELEDFRQQIDAEVKQRQNLDRLAKQVKS